MKRPRAIAPREFSRELFLCRRIRTAAPSAHVALALAGLLCFSAGCDSISEIVLPAPPIAAVELRVAPQPLDSVFYQVRLEWTVSDPAGALAHFIYAIDPPALGDTAWVRTEQTEITLLFKSSTPSDALDVPGSVISSDFHVFVIEAVSTAGATSPPTYRAFTSYTVAPQTQIISPLPNRLKAAVTPTKFLIQWEGFDEDGTITQEPVRYKIRLDSVATLREALGLTRRDPNAAEIQDFYSSFAPTFTGWDSVPAESSFTNVSGLEAGVKHLFTVVAIDEAGAYEPRFLLDNNVLQFITATAPSLPIITIFNSYFTRTQPKGMFSLAEEDVLRFELLVDLRSEITFNWFAETPLAGTHVEGYRWVIDPVDGDIFDETPRSDSSDVHRWSDWSLAETRVDLGPSEQGPNSSGFRFYLQARDNIGFVSMMVVEIRLIRPTFENPLLVFDDLSGPPDREVLGDPDNPLNNQPFGTYPTEAVLDTLLYAVGDVPYRFRPAGTLSDAGVFAGFEYDTLDYRFFPFEGLPIKILARYRAVVWYSGLKDASSRGKKFATATNVMSAIRFANTLGELNTLAPYLSQGGRVWLFGGGILTGIANGYVSRFGSFPFAAFPYTGEGDRPSRESILWPGNFIHDYLHVRSEIDDNTRGFFSSSEELVDAIPYLPGFRTPGAPWPPTGWTGGRGPMDDPRIGPSSLRNVSRWAGLPLLTITTEFSDWPGSLPDALGDIAYISHPNEILEDTDGDPSTPPESRLDTLYLMRARKFDLRESPTNADGKPVFFYYWGEDNGPVAWTAMPLWMFERTQLQKVTELILAEFGFTRKPDRRTWTGPGSVHDKLPHVVEAHE